MSRLGSDPSLPTFPGQTEGRRGDGPLPRLRARTAALLLLALLGGCAGIDDDLLLQIRGEGELDGTVFLDLNRDGNRSGGEPGIGGAGVAIVTAGSRDTVFLAQTDTAGHFGVPSLPAAGYRIHVSPALLGDSLQVVRLDPDPVVVPAGRGAEVTLALSYPIRSVQSARELPAGVRTFVRGVALTAPGSIPEGAFHLRGESRAIRITLTEGFGAQPGDSVLVLGRTARFRGEAVLAQGSGRRLRESQEEAPPVSSTTAQASTAWSGSRDADLVEVTGVEVIEVSTAFGEVAAQVTDGSGPLLLRFPASFLFELRVESLEPGMVLDARGILVPAATGGSWELRPRVHTDLRGLPPS